MRQLIIARKDLQMSPGKLAAQVSHASMAFLTHIIRENTKTVWKYRTSASYQIDRQSGEKKPRLFRRTDLGLLAADAFKRGEDYFTYRPEDPEKPLEKYELCENEILEYHADLKIDKDLYEDWICGIFTKTICEARNRNHLMKAVSMAEEMGLEENKDFFLIKDNCLTELEPEEVGDDGIGRTLTCIGFRPLPDDAAHQISRKYQLYK